MEDKKNSSRVKVLQAAFYSSYVDSQTLSTFITVKVKIKVNTHVNLRTIIIKKGVHYEIISVRGEATGIESVHQFKNPQLQTMLDQILNFKSIRLKLLYV